MLSPFTTLHAIWTHPANAGSRIPALARYCWWQTAKRTWLLHYDLAYHGLRLRCHRDSHSASAALYFSGLPDYREMQFMRRYLRAGDTFVDVGANVGVYSLLAAALVGPAGCVHAFEPMPSTLGRLRENVELNRLSHVHCHGLAVTDSSGRRRLTNTHDDCVVTLAPDGTGSERDPEIACTTLDEFLPDIGMAMLKVDIEGAEPLALRGAIGHLRRANPPVMQLEMDGYCKRFGISTWQFIEEIEAAGYRLHVYDPEANALIPTHRPWEHAVRNVLAIHHTRLEEVRLRLSVHRPPEPGAART